MARFRPSRSPVHISRAPALALVVCVAAAACGVSSADSRSKGAGQLYLQPVADAGPDPWTQSTAKQTPGSSTPPSATASPPEQTPQPRVMSGSTAGLYGGTRNVTNCDVEKQIRFFAVNPAKRAAFAEVQKIQPGQVPVFLRSLTTVVLRADTRVTNHGFTDGKVTGFQSVLQAGTAVLVDHHGFPRVRCACGNPLTQSGKVSTGAVYKGKAWSGYQPQRTVVVKPSTTVINNIVIIDVTTNIWIERPLTHRDKPHDRVVPKPPHPDPHSPTPSPSHSPSHSPSPTPSPTATPDAPTGLEGEASGPQSIRLTWDPAEDPDQVDGYEVHQKGVPGPVQTTGGTTTSADIEGLEPGQDYTFTVRALGPTGAASDASDPVTVTLPPVESPTPTPEPPPTAEPDVPTAAPDIPTDVPDLPTDVPEPLNAQPDVPAGTVPQAPDALDKPNTPDTPDAQDLQPAPEQPADY
ncbi:fibronectin type III domain-containing protein [Streptomyces sp. NPDC051940]|uniref:fibronectin type III domain-containing protein n=1 Tax=Streptomyces sp. NPDC051940 TaxID=3155675 RepID=UPI003433F5FC